MDKKLQTKLHKALTQMARLNVEATKLLKDAAWFDRLFPITPRHQAITRTLKAIDDLQLSINIINQVAR
jgi:hypothetical protein